MKMKTIRLTFSLLCALLLFAQTASAQVHFEEAFGALFHDVQMAGIFEDSKTFPDCLPKYPPTEILERYKRSKGHADFGLREFVMAHFDLPPEPGKAFKSDATLDIREHIEKLWPILQRQPDETGGSLIPLPKPYVVPGGRFREIYYWDSYFTMLGLQQSGKNTTIRNMVENFAHLIDEVGFIPNGNRTYFLSRSQPPFFSLMVGLLAELEGEAVYREFLPQLTKEYAFWMDGAEGLTAAQPTYRRLVRLSDKVVLNRYFDDSPNPRPESYKEDVELAEHSSRPAKALYTDLRAACESGWDFSSRWLRNPQKLETIHTTELIPVDLNCLLYGLEETLQKAYAANGEQQMAEQMGTKAQHRKAAILQYCWDGASGFFYDYDFKKQAVTGRVTAAGFYPLFFKLCSAKMAKRAAKFGKKQLLKDGGLCTTLQASGQQWDAPNGWPPLQWMAYKGMQNYGLKKMAQTLAERWIANNKRVYRNTGKMVEKYNVTDITLEAGGGEYRLQDGFGWSNGVLLRLMADQK